MKYTVFAYKRVEQSIEVEAPDLQSALVKAETSKADEWQETGLVDYDEPHCVMDENNKQIDL